MSNKRPHSVWLCVRFKEPNLPCFFVSSSLVLVFLFSTLGFCNKILVIGMFIMHYCNSFIMLFSSLSCSGVWLKKQYVCRLPLTVKPWKLCVVSLIFSQWRLSSVTPPLLSPSIDGVSVPRRHKVGMLKIANCNLNKLYGIRNNVVCSCCDFLRGISKFIIFLCLVFLASD